VTTQLQLINIIIIIIKHGNASVGSIRVV